MDLYSYDSAGNLMNDGSHQYFYDAENRLIQVDGAPGTCASGSSTGTTACYYYDGFGHRIHRSGFHNDTCDASGMRDYFYDPAGHAVLENVWNYGTACNIEIYAGNRHLLHQGGGSFFYHSDWLGTNRLVNALPYVTYAYDSCTSLPFGDGLTCNSTFQWRQHFTDKERDFESGLDNFGARYNSSSFGRFMSPDGPFNDQTQNNPQSWNLYSYARNNPLTNLDIDGKKCVKLDNGSQGDDGTGGGCAAAGVDASGNEKPMQVNVTMSGEDRALMILAWAGERGTDWSVLEGGRQVAIGETLGGMLGSFFKLFRGGDAVLEMFSGGVTREALQEAARGGGSTVRLVVTVDGTLSASRTIYAATGDSADSVAAAAGGSSKYVANVPKNLLTLMRRAGLATTELTQMGRSAAETYKIDPQGAEFVLKFFHKVN